MLAGIVEFLGWFGAVTVLAGYLLFSMGKLPNGPVYQLFNLVGGLAVAINVAAHHAVPSTIVNGIWAVVAVVVLVKMARARRAAKRGAPAAEQPVLHTEPAATTAVLPIIGPALRDHGSEATEQPAAEPRLQSVTTDATTVATTDAMTVPTTDAMTVPTTDAMTVPTTDATTDATRDATTEATTPAAPMTASIPVITATIALALVAAAQEQHDQQEQQEQHDPHDRQPQHADRTPA